MSLGAPCCRAQAPQSSSWLSTMVSWAKTPLVNKRPSLTYEPLALASAPLRLCQNHSTLAQPLPTSGDAPTACRGSRKKARRISGQKRIPSCLFRGHNRTRGLAEAVTDDGKGTSENVRARRALNSEPEAGALSLLPQQSWYQVMGPSVSFSEKCILQKGPHADVWWI